MIKYLRVKCNDCLKSYTGYFDTNHVQCEHCGNDFAEDLVYEEVPFPKAKDLIDRWILHGKRALYEKHGFNPKLTRDSFLGCETLSKLVTELMDGLWSIGNSLYWQNICFINIETSPREWLVLKEDSVIEIIEGEALSSRLKIYKYLVKIIEK